MKSSDLLSRIAHILEGQYPVYIQVPQKALYPYISIELTSLTEGGFNLPGMRKILAQFKIQGWSRYQGAKEILEISHHIQKQLSDRILDLQKGIKASSRCKNHKTRILNDGSTRLFECNYEMGIIR